MSIWSLGGSVRTVRVCHKLTVCYVRPVLRSTERVCQFCHKWTALGSVIKCKAPFWCTFAPGKKLLKGSNLSWVRIGVYTQRFSVNFIFGLEAFSVQDLLRPGDADFIDCFPSFFRSFSLLHLSLSFFFLLSLSSFFLLSFFFSLSLLFSFLVFLL